MLQEWIDFRFVTVRRRTEHRLQKVNDRIHILEGRLIVFLNIDEVIRIIRESDEPKPALIARFNLSDRQAEDILEIRLRQLARLEGIKIEQELAELQSERAELEYLLANAAAMQKLVIKEIEADRKKYADPRRTLIEQAERATLEVAVVDEPTTLILSEKGWMRARQGHGIDLQNLAFKDGDALLRRLSAAPSTRWRCLVRMAGSIPWQRLASLAVAAMACPSPRWWSWRPNLVSLRC